MGAAVFNTAAPLPFLGRQRHRPGLPGQGGPGDDKLVIRSSTSPNGQSRPGAPRRKMCCVAAGELIRSRRTEVTKSRSIIPPSQDGERWIARTSYYELKILKFWRAGKRMRANPARQSRTDRRSSRAVCVASLASICVSLVLGGCGAIESRAQRTSLSESGFLARVPQTERQRDFYAALPPYELYWGVRNGQPFYVYKDEKAGVVYVGNEQDYQRYIVKMRRLIAYYETTEAKMVARRIDENVQARWDGSWSPKNRESSGHGHITAEESRENTRVPAPTPSRNLNFNDHAWD